MTRFEYTMSHIFSCFGALSTLRGNIFMNHYLLILYLQPFVNIEYSSISISCERARDIDKYILLPKIYFTAKNIQPRYETDNTLFCENKDVKNCDANYRKRLLFTRWVNMKECETLKYFLKKQVNLTSKQTWKHFV